MTAYCEIAAQSAYDMFSSIVSNCQFSVSHLGFWSGNFFLIAPFPDHCLLVPFDEDDTIMFVVSMNTHAFPRNTQCPFKK